LHASLEFPWTF
nr:immunoglobulin light chain junction region [Macaca mulatta]